MKNENAKELIIKEFEKAGFTNYYMQMFDKDCELSERIYLLLKFLGMDQSFGGFKYTEYALKDILENPNEDIRLEGLYEIIAKKYKKTPSSIERCIRTARLKVLENMKPELKFLIFGAYTKNFTNAGFLWAIANFITHEIC